MIIILKNNESLICDDFKFKCSIGKNGRQKIKKKVIKKHQKVLLELEIYFIEKIEKN